MVTEPRSNELTHHFRLRSKSLRRAGPIYITPEEVEKERFTQNTHQMFSVQSTPGEFEVAKIIGNFGFVFEENGMIFVTLPFSN